MINASRRLIRCLPLLALLSMIAVDSRAQKPHALVSRDFRLGPIPEGTDSLIVRQRLGRPEHIRSQASSPDATAQTVIWSYPHFRLYFIGLSIHGVAGVETTDSALVTARGLRVGEPAARLTALYGAPTGTYEDTWDYEDPAATLHVLRFTVRDGRVVAIYSGWIVD